MLGFGAIQLSMARPFMLPILMDKCIRWTRRAEKTPGQHLPDGPITGSPLLTTDGVIVTTESGSVYSIDHNGKVLWSTSIGGKIYTAPVASGNLVMVAPLGAQYLLYAVNEKDGSMLPWHFDGK